MNGHTYLPTEVSSASKKTDNNFFFSNTPSNRGFKNLSISIENRSYGMSFKKDSANQPHAKSSSKAAPGQNVEKSVSRERNDSNTNKILHTENNQSSLKANQDRIKTLNSFFSRKDREAESQPMMTETGIFSKKGFRPSDVKRAPYKLIDPLSKTKKSASLKPTEVFSFQIENPKQIKEKILKFCKTNNINIIEVSYD